jgi:uncharacterized protein with HEPN domain
MSDTRDAQRDTTTLIDIQRACGDIVAETQSLTPERFLFDERSQALVLHRLIILGEATKRLSMTVRSRYPEIPWREMAGTRDVLIHDYDDVILDRVWSTAVNDIPRILDQITLVLREYPTESPDSDTSPV